MSSISKRFNDPSDWEKPYFTELDERQRLLLLYLKGRCELCGVFQLHFPVDSAYLGFTLDRDFIKEFLSKVNDDTTRIEPLEDQRLWLKGFVRYQQIGPKRNFLSKDSPPHKSIVKGLKEHGIFKQAVDEDPVLFQAYTGEIIETVEPPTDDTDTDSQGLVNPNATLGQGIPKSISNSTSNGIGHSSSPHSHSISESLKKIIPGFALLDVGELAYQGDVEQIIEQLKEDNVKEPENYVIDVAKNFEWENQNWDGFLSTITNGKETPF